MRLKCLFGWHEYKTAYYYNAQPQFTPQSITKDWTGKVTVHGPHYMGFLHQGLVSNCEHCKKLQFVDYMSERQIEKLDIVDPKETLGEDTWAIRTN